MDVEVRHNEVAQQTAAVGVGIGAHAPHALRGELGQLWHQPALLIKKLFCLVTLHPTFQQCHMIGMLGIHQQRHLVRSERALHLQTVHDFRSRPALG